MWNAKELMEEFGTVQNCYEKGFIRCRQCGYYTHVACTINEYCDDCNKTKDDDEASYFYNHITIESLEVEDYE